MADGRKFAPMVKSQMTNYTQKLSMISILILMMNNYGYYSFMTIGPAAIAVVLNIRVLEV